MLHRKWQDLRGKYLDRGIGPSWLLACQTSPETLGMVASFLEAPFAVPAFSSYRDTGELSIKERQDQTSGEMTDAGVLGKSQPGHLHPVAAAGI